MRLIISADDIGLSKSVTDGIIDGLNEGIITSTSIMVNMKYADYAVECMKKNGYDRLGVHLCITAGKSLTDCPTLTRGGYFLTAKEQLSDSTIDQQELYTELKAQIEWVRSRGLEVDHLDGHHSIEDSYYIYDTVKRLALEYNIPMRSTSTKIVHNMDPKTPNLYLDTFSLERQTVDELELLVKKYKDYDITVELLTHCGYMDDYTRSVTSHQTRETELNCLRQAFNNHLFDNIKLISYKEL